MDSACPIRKVVFLQVNCLMFALGLSRSHAWSNRAHDKVDDYGTSISPVVTARIGIHLQKFGMALYDFYILG